MRRHKRIVGSVIALACATAGCKDKPKAKVAPPPVAGPGPAIKADALGASPTTKATVVDVAAIDAMWKKAPATPFLAFVGAPSATAHILEFPTFVASLPAALRPPEAEELAKVWGKAGSAAAAGMTADRGFAFFMIEPAKKAEGPDGVRKPPRFIAVLPVVDGAKFAAAYGGTVAANGDITISKDDEAMTCRVVAGDFACTPQVADLALLGSSQGALVGKASVSGQRGNFEALIDLPRSGDELPIANAGMVRGVATLARGEVSVRVEIDGRLPVPAGVWAAKGGQRVDPLTAGFASLNLGDGLRMLIANDPPPNAQARTLLESFAGAVLVTVPAGRQALVAHAPLRDPAPATEMLSHCDKLLMKKHADGSCEFPAMGPWPFATHIWLDGTSMRAGTARTVEAPVTLPMTARGSEIARDYPFAVWGRGIAPDLTKYLPPGAPPAMQRVLMVVAAVSEAGLGVEIGDTKFRAYAYLRTLHANPPEVVAGLGDQLFTAGAARADKLAALAKAHPQSPLAEDLQAGDWGLVPAAALIGGLAASAMPKFVEAQDQAQTSVVQLELDRVRKAAAVAFVENGAFPKGKVGLTPAAPCCSFPNELCPIDDASFADPVWKALDFVALTGQAQLSYESDGQTYRATAISDPGCTGSAKTLVLEGKIDNGQPIHRTLTP